MAVGAFVKSVDQVENIGNDTYRVTCNVSIMDASNSQFSISFDAVKGADWKILCRTAVASKALSDLGETVDLVVLPGLETI